MNKKFKLNGVDVKLSKEQLQEMIKKFDEPEWEIKKDNYGDIKLFKGKENITLFFSDRLGKGTLCNLQTLSYAIAKAMEDTLTWKEQRDEMITGYNIIFSQNRKKFRAEANHSYINNKHFKTYAKVQLAVELLNESTEIKDLFDKWDKESE